MTVVGAVVAFVPRPTVSEGAPIDPRNSLSAPFTVANNTIIPLENVSLGIGLCYMRLTNDEGGSFLLKGGNCKGQRKGKLIFARWFHPTLAPDERQEIILSDVIQGAVAADADIAISVAYQPWFLPWRREKQFRFVTRRVNGMIFWSPQPLD